MRSHERLLEALRVEGRSRQQALSQRTLLTRSDQRRSTVNARFVLPIGSVWISGEIHQTACQSVGSGIRNTDERRSRDLA
jgi:hypothetical protein